MTSGNSERLGKASGAARRLFAVLVGLLATVALIVSGAGAASAQNVVGPQPHILILAVGAQSLAAPESVGLHTLPLRHQASATDVAADEVPEYVVLASPQRTEHILNGDATGGGHMWPGAPGKTSFPQDWSGAKIMHEASDIATDPNSTILTRGGGREILTGTREGVDIRVVVDYNNNDIITAYPTNLPRNS